MNYELHEFIVPVISIKTTGIPKQEYSASR